MASVGNVRLTAGDIKLSFVIALHKTQVKAATVEQLFRNTYGAELFEVIDDMRKVDAFPTQEQAVQEAHEVRMRIAAQWPCSRLCIVVTSFGLSSAYFLRRPIVANMALTCRKHVWTAKILNLKTVEKMVKGADIPYPTSFRKTNKELRELVRLHGKVSNVPAPGMTLPAPYRT